MVVKGCLSAHEYIEYIAVLEYTSLFVHVHMQCI